MEGNPLHFSFFIKAIGSKGIVPSGDSCMRGGFGDSGSSYNTSKVGGGYYNGLTVVLHHHMYHL